MARPNLQIALDNSTLASAVESIREAGPVVDIVEVGTILCLQEGAEAIRVMRAMFPEKIIIADTKCADAGGTVAKNCKDAGADWMTVICAATIPTMKAAQKEIATLQVELYGDWTLTQAKQWREMGIDQVIYHQSRDALIAGETWGENDLTKVKTLIDMGFKVSVTGGLEIETLELFKGLDVYTFIAGRGITSKPDPKKAAQDFIDEIKRIWGE